MRLSVMISTLVRMKGRGAGTRVGESVLLGQRRVPDCGTFDLDCVSGSGDVVLGAVGPGESLEELAAARAWEGQFWTELGAVSDTEGAEYAALVAEVEEALAGMGQEADPAQDLAGGLEVAGRGLARAGQVGAEGLVAVFESELVAGLEAAGRVRNQVIGQVVALARECWERGLHNQVGMSLPTWLRVRCQWLSKQEACQILDVVRAGECDWGSALALAVVQGRTGVDRGALVARTMRRLVPCLSAEQAQDYAGIATDAAIDPQISDADLQVVCKKLLTDLLDEKPREETKDTAQALRTVSRRALGRGMTRFTVDAPEVEAALIDGVLNGPLAAPVPDKAALDDGGGLDLRSPGQRKFDALLMVLNRGMSNPGAPPSSGRASVMVTVTADPDTGKPAGAALSNTGAVLDAAQAGRLACIGDLTPIVLGEHGEPLSLGRTVRLATPGQFKALMVRDRHCTYPGCDVPGTWCDAHHIIWWCRGGGTDIAFLVLLCPRHHTLVHDKDLIATIAGSIVTWHV